MKTTHRIHEWLADRISFIQYPGVSEVRQSENSLRWRHPMPLWDRLCLALISLFTIVVSLGLLGAFLMIAWAFIGA